MGEIAVQYFNDIFSSSAGLEVEETVRVIDRVVTTDMNCQLLSPFTDLEIQQAAFQMHPQNLQVLTVCLVFSFKNIGIL